MRRNKLDYKLLSMLLVLALAFETVFFVSKDFLNNGGFSALRSSPTIASSSNGRAQSPFTVPQLTLTTKWSDTVKKLVDAHALNLSFIERNVRLTPKEARILNGTSNSSVTLNASDSMFDLYVLWALGINNRNAILSNGSIMHFGGNPYALASTGGYGPLGSLSLGNLTILNLTPAEQALASSVASNVYRPCCNNPAAFPDCNHGAAQLGLIELMASQGSNSTAIYDAMKEFNALYFPQQYAELAIYFNATRNMSWKQMPANLVVGYNYSSYSGSANIHRFLLSRSLLPSVQGSSGSCGA